MTYLITLCAEYVAVLMNLLESRRFSRQETKEAILSQICAVVYLKQRAADIGGLKQKNLSQRVLSFVPRLSTS